MNRAPFAAATGACALLVSLWACGPRHQDRDEPKTTPTSSASSTPAATVTPSASIIRPDITPEPVVDLPPPPLTLTIGFPAGGAALDATAQQALTQMLASEQFAEPWPIILRGHSDSAGSDQANLHASRHRAEAVADWLRQHGVAEDRIEIIAFGEQNPVAPNAKPDGTPNEAGRAKNRRVDIRIAPPAQPVPEESGGAEQKEAGKGA